MVGRLDDGGLDAIGGDPLEHGGKAGAGSHGVNPRDGLVLEAVNEFEPGRSGKGGDRGALAFLAVLVGAG